MAPPHRLPLAKRPRREPSEDSHTPAPSSSAGDILVDEQAYSSVVSLDLITELVCNGSLGPHFDALHTIHHRAGWRSKSRLTVEVEVGCLLAAVDVPAEARAGGSVAGGTLPMLLRAFRKQLPIGSEAASAPMHRARHPGGRPAPRHLGPGKRPESRRTRRDSDRVLHIASALAAAGLPLRPSRGRLHPPAGFEHVQPWPPTPRASWRACRCAGP